MVRLVIAMDIPYKSDEPSMQHIVITNSNQAELLNVLEASNFLLAFI
jgi:hypothetical protein